MLDRIERLISSRASGKAIFIAFLFFAAVATVLNRASHALEPKAGGAPVPDLHLAISEAEAHRIFGLYGEEGRRFYFRVILFADTAYPLAYTCVLALLIAYLGRRAISLQSPLRYLCLMPFVAMIADYGENIGLLTMCFHYPERWPILGMITLICNSLKWTFVGASVFVSLILLLVLGAKRLAIRETP